MICGKPTPKQKQRLYWREEMNHAKKAMELYPVGSDEREIYRAKYNEAAMRYNELFEEVCYGNGRKVNT
jgi:hypothetical protein